MAVLDNIDKLTYEEKLEAICELERSIEQERQQMEDPIWVGEILRDRISLMDAPDAEFLTVDEAKRSVLKMIPGNGN